MRFSNKTCVVTGAGSGIGRAIATLFAEEEGTVVIVDLNEGHGTDCLRTLTSRGLRAAFVQTDVSNEEQVRRAIERALEFSGSIDIVVNDAAMMTFSPITETPTAAWDQVMHVNLRSVFLMSKYCIPHMKEGGAIVNISSVHAHETTRNVVPYAASKGGIESFTKGLALELQPRGIRVNCVAPGAVDTPMLWENPNVKSGREKISGRIGRPEEIAEAVAFLASDRSSFIDATTLVVDGGRLEML